MDHEETTTAEARGIRTSFTIADDRYEAVHEADEYAVRREYEVDEDAGVLRADTRYVAGGRAVDEAQSEWDLTDDGESVAAAGVPVEVFARQYHNDDPQGDIDRARGRA